MKHPVIITSLKRSVRLPNEWDYWSSAVYQPKGFDYPKAEWCDIRLDGMWIRPRDFIDQADPLKAYHHALLTLYAARYDDMKSWLRSTNDTTVLCCWCPYDRAAQRQIGEFGTFVCHTAVLGEVITDAGWPVYYDDDRRKMAVLP